jgi:hypothetical protein
VDVAAPLLTTVENSYPAEAECADAPDEELEEVTEEEDEECGKAEDPDDIGSCYAFRHCEVN